MWQNIKRSTKNQMSSIIYIYIYNKWVIHGKEWLQVAG